MPTTTRRITCEVCGLSYPAMMWRANSGYCPNCDQPYGPNARKLLDLPRLDLEEDDFEERARTPGMSDRYA